MPFSSQSTAVPTSDCLVMLGVTGDLAKKKLFPAVYRLHCRWLLEVPIIGLARPHWGEDQLREHARDVDPGGGREVGREAVRRR